MFEQKVINLDEVFTSNTNTDNLGDLNHAFKKFKHVQYLRKRLKPGGTWLPLIAILVPIRAHAI